MTRKILQLALLVVVLSTAVVTADVPSSIDGIVAEFMKQHKSRAVGVSIVANRQIGYVHSYGALKNDQPFDLASVSKSLTAIVAVKLAEEGKLDLDAPVSTYLPEVKLPAGVTCKALLSHTSGIPHYTEHFPGAGFTLANFTPDAMAQAPGKGFIYSSPGFYLLSKVMEKVTHMAYLPMMNQYLGTPAGVHLSLDPTHGWREGAGGLMASPDGMAHIMQAILQGKILSQKGYELLWTPVAKEDGYALGWYVSEGPPIKISHNGSHPDEGIATRMVLFPESGNGVVVLTQNEGEADPGDLTTALISALK